MIALLYSFFLLDILYLRAIFHITSNFYHSICLSSRLVHIYSLILLQYNLELPLEMANLKKKLIASLKYNLHQTILFLCPMTEDAILGLNTTENNYYNHISIINNQVCIALDKFLSMRSQPNSL